MDLSTIIVSWNVKDKLRENLQALFNSDNDFNFEVFVVDNDSLDGSADMVRNEFPQVKLIANKRNLGFAKANNQALRYATGRYILLLNPDNKVFNDTLSHMIGWLDNHPEAWVASCHLVDQEGHTIKHVRRFPTVWDQLAIILKLPHLWPSVLNKYLFNDFDYSRPAQVDSVRGGFFMINTAVWRGLPLRFDEQYFLWFEEVDLCKQIKKAGGQVWYTPAAECLDYVGQSFKQVRRGVAQRYFRNSMLKYFRKWHSPWQYKLLKIIWPIGRFLAFISEMFNVKSKTRT